MLGMNQPSITIRLLDGYSNAIVRRQIPRTCNPCGTLTRKSSAAQGFDVQIAVEFRNGIIGRAFEVRLLEIKTCLKSRLHCAFMFTTDLGRSASYTVIRIGPLGGVPFPAVTTIISTLFTTWPHGRTHSSPPNRSIAFDFMLIVIL